MADGEATYSPVEVESTDVFPVEIPEGNMLKWLSIAISEQEKRTGTSMKIQETFTVYLIECRITDQSVAGCCEGVSTVWRRYSEFELLRNYLCVIFPEIVVPPLPEKRVSHAWQKLATDKFDLDFIDRRRVGLENFILRVASHGTLHRDKIFHAFLKQEKGWKEAVYATDYQAKVDSKFRTLSASYRLKRPNRQFEEIKNYSSELQTHISNIVKIRTRLVDRLFGIHRVHANYGRVFSEWSGLEKQMAHGLQSGGQFIDVYSTSIDGLLEDEEQFADQLKEYLGFGDSLRAVCRKQELLQLTQEKAEDGVTAKKANRQQLVEGRTSSLSLSGLKSKIFGSETSEQREARLKQLDEQLSEAEEQLKVTTNETQKFVDAALGDIERFKRQKVKDMKEILTNYSLMQIDRCKKGIQVWQNVRECFSEKM